MGSMKYVREDFDDHRESQHVCARAVAFPSKFIPRLEYSSTATADSSILKSPDSFREFCLCAVLGVSSDSQFPLSESTRPNHHVEVAIN